MRSRTVLCLSLTLTFRVFMLVLTSITAIIQTLKNKSRVWSMGVRTGRHCVFMLHAHLIFITKHRGRVFTNSTLKRLEEICYEVCSQFEVELKEFNGEQDHVHLLVNYPPKIQLSKLINSLKGVSSRRLKAEFQEIREYWICKRSGALWSPSYFAGSVSGAPLIVLRQYIEKQNRPTSLP